MKEKTNHQSLFVAILLIVAGTVSPSNGLDDKVDKSPMELLITMICIVSATLFIYVLWNGKIQDIHKSKAINQIKKTHNL